MRKHAFVSIVLLCLSQSICVAVNAAKNTTADANLINCSSGERLVLQIDNFDMNAIEKAFTSLSCYDGSVLEDIYRSLGVAFSEKPDEVLDRMQKSHIDISEVSPIFTALPVSYIDDDCGAETELRRRKQLIILSKLPETTKVKLVSNLEKSINLRKSNCFK